MTRTYPRANPVPGEWYTGPQRRRSLDGDTIEVLHNNRAERIRLNGIDCPALRAI
jgi:endonuclease YncB( thermonuclease family)